MDGPRRLPKFFSLAFRPWSPLILGTIIGALIAALASPMTANGHVEAAWNALGYPLAGAIAGALAGFIVESWLRRRDHEKDFDSK